MIWLESARLLFRDHEPRDLEAYCAIESDAEYRAPQPVHPRAELERSFREGWLVPKPMGLRATVIRASDTYIGRCGLYPLRDDSGQVIEHEARIAYYIGRPFWRQGFAGEAARAFVEHGFATLGLHRIEAGINAQNAASLRIVERLGFTRVRSGGEGGIRWHDYELRNPALTSRP